MPARKNAAEEGVSPADLLGYLERRADADAEERDRRATRDTDERRAMIQAFATESQATRSSFDRGMGKLARVGIVMGTLMILGLLALAGVQVSYSGEAGSLDLSPPAPEMMPAEEEPPVGETVDPAGADREFDEVGPLSGGVPTG